MTGREVKTVCPFCDRATVTLAKVEKRYILLVLKQNNGHRRRTARALGIGLRTLGMKLKAWGMVK